MEGSSHGLIQRIIPVLARGTEENHGNPQNSRSPGQDLHPAHPEHEAGELTTWPPREDFTLLFQVRSMEFSTREVSDVAYVLYRLPLFIAITAMMGLHTATGAEH
jgi:hypothetical protein